MSSYPNLQNCFPVLERICGEFPEETFSATELRDRCDADETTVRTALKLLVAYGFLAREGSDAYTLRYAPWESEERWYEKGGSHAVQLRQVVIERLDGSTERPTGLVDREDGEYVAVTVDDSTGLESLLEQLDSRTLREEEGVVLVSHAELANVAQNLAAELERHGSMDLEKADTEVVTRPDGSLQYRLYLEPSD